jgi:hypothetical protein
MPHHLVGSVHYPTQLPVALLQPLLSQLGGHCASQRVYHHNVLSEQLLMQFPVVLAQPNLSQFPKQIMSQFCPHLVGSLQPFITSVEFTRYIRFTEKRRVNFIEFNLFLILHTKDLSNLLYKSFPVNIIYN